MSLQDKSRCFLWRQVVHQLTADIVHCFHADNFVAVVKLIRIIRSKRLFMDDTEPRNMQYVRPLPPPPQSPVTVLPTVQ